MTTLTEGKHTGEFIGELAMGIGFHVDEVTALSGQSWAAGDVVAKVTASGKWVKYDNTLSNGAEVALGVSYSAMSASGADNTKARVLVRGPAIINANDLGWGSNDAAGIAAGKVDLLALGIKAA